MIPACEAYLAEEDWTGWFTSRADEFARGMSQCLGPSDHPGFQHGGAWPPSWRSLLVSTQTREAAPHCAFRPRRSSKAGAPSVPVAPRDLVPVAREVVRPVTRARRVGGTRGLPTRRSHALGHEIHAGRWMRPTR